MASAPMPDTAWEASAEGGAVPEDYVPEGFESQDEFLKDMRYQYRCDLAYDRHNREPALDDKRFWSGDQWDAKVLLYRKNLPCLTINTLPQFTSQLTGDWRSQGPAVKVLPDEDGDVDVAEVRTDLIRNIEVQSRAGRAVDNAFESMIICGDGAYRINVEYARDDVFDQDIRIAPIDDALSVLWDRFSIDATGRDAKRCFVDDLIDREAFDKRWPDQSPSMLSAERMNTLASDGWYTSPSGESQMVRVTEYWRLIERMKLLAMFADGKTRDITDMAPEDVVAQWGVPIRTRNSPCSYAQMHLVTGHAILEGPYEYRLTRLPIIRMTGRVINIDGKRVRFGVIRPMKDSARYRNFTRSKSAEYLGYATTAKWIGPVSAFEGREAQWRNSHLNGDTLLTYNDNASVPPREVPPPQIPAAFLNESAVSAQDMKDVSGLHDASLGIRSNETSGIAIQARQREGDVANIVYFDNGNDAVMEGGDVINQLIDQVYDGARIVRRLGQDGAAEMVKINQEGGFDLLSGRYDVTITTGPSYTTKRVEAAQAMEKFFQGSPGAQQAYGDLYFKMLDVPYADEFAERARKMLPPQLQDDGEDNPVPPQVQAQMQQLAQLLQALQAENQELKTDRSLEERKIDIDAYKAESDRIKAVTAKGFPLGPEGADMLQAVVKQAVIEVLASPDVLPPPAPEPGMMVPATPEAPDGPAPDMMPMPPIDSAPEEGLPQQ